MKKITFLVAVLAVSMSFGQNLLKNGNVETWNYGDEDASLSSWSSRGDVYQEVGDVYEGMYSGRMEGFGDPQNFLGDSSVSQIINFGGSNDKPESGNYIVEGWCRVFIDQYSEGITAGNFTWLNHDFMPIEGGEYIEFTNGFDEWTKFKAIIKSPEEAYSFSYELYVEGGVILFFDDLKFYKEGTFSTPTTMEVEFKLFPNPAKDVFEIGVAKKGAINVSVYNVMGQKVVATTHKTINCASLKQGVYFVEVTQNGKTSVKRLVID